MRDVGVDIDALRLLPLPLQFPTARAWRCANGRAGAAVLRAVLRRQAGAGATSWPCWLPRTLVGERFRCAEASPCAELCTGAAARRARAADRTAVRRRTQHPGRAGQRRRCSCASCTMRCSPAPARPTCCCPPRRLGALLPLPAAAAVRAPRRAPDTTARAAELQPMGAAGRSTANASMRWCWPPAHRGRWLCRPVAPDGRSQAATLRYEPIVTVYLAAPGHGLP